MLEQMETLTIHSGSTYTPNYSMIILLAALALVLLISYSIRQDLDKKKMQKLKKYKEEVMEQQQIMKRKKW